jgi:hypothetical protein
MKFLPLSLILIVFSGLQSAAANDPIEDILKALGRNKAKKALVLAKNAQQSRALGPADSQRQRQLKILITWARCCDLWSSNNPKSQSVDAIQRELAAIDKRVSVDDVLFLRQSSKQVPLVIRPYVERALRRARSKALDITDIVAYLRAMSIEDQPTRELATAAIARQIARCQLKLRAGQSLSSQDQKFFSSALLVTALIDQLGRESPIPSLDQAPALTTALYTKQGRAIHALILIDTAAIERLDIAKKAGMQRAASALKLLQKNQQRRRHRQPKKSWTHADKSKAKTLGPKGKRKTP